MGKVSLILKRCLYYIIGLISFSTIAFITQRIVTSVLLETSINPTQDLYNIKYYILSFGPFYLMVYTLIYLVILYSVCKYDKYIMNKLNEKLEKVKKYQENSNGGDNNV